MNLPIPQVIIGFDKMVMKTLFEQGTRYEDLIENITTSGALMFDSRSNPNFIDFEHSFGGSEKGNIMKITLIDPKNEFEKLFMMGSSSDTVANYLKAKADPRTEGYTITPSIGPYAAEARRKIIERREKEITGWNEKFKKSFIESVGAHRPVYISYGVGSNLDAWTGPHTMRLYGAELSVQGARQITLLFAATDLSFSTEGRRDIYQQQVNIDLAGLGIEIDAVSHPFKFTSNISDLIYPQWVMNFPQMALYLSVGTIASGKIKKESDEYRTFFRDVGLAAVGLFTESIDIHLLITDIIRDLIRKATGNSNVIVLLPNINYTNAYHIKQFLVEHGIEKFEEGAKSAEDAAEKDAQEAADATQHAGFVPFQRGGTAPSQMLNIYNTFYSKYDNKGKKFYVLNSILNSFGLDLRTFTSDGSMVEGVFKELEGMLPRYALVTHPTTGEVGLGFEPSVSVGEYPPPPQPSKFNKTLEDFLKANSFTGGVTQRSDDGFPDYWAILNRIKGQLLAGSKGIHGSHFELFYESDLNLLELWASKEYKDYPLFGGPDRTFTSDSGAIVFGDQQLIRDYLYGAHSLESLARKEERTIKAYEKLAIGEDEAFVKEGGASFFLGHGASKRFKNRQEVRKRAALLNLTPLHPIDKALLTSEEYNKKVRVITYPPHPIVGAYGDISHLPDEFQHVENLSGEDKKFIENHGIPVFRYNTSNPNVLDLKLAKNDVYYKNLNVGFQRDVARRASYTVRGILRNDYVDFDFLDWGDVVEFARFYAKSLGDDPQVQKKVTSYLEKKLEAFDLGFMQGKSFKDQAAAAWTAYEEGLKNPDHPTIILDQMNPGDPVIAMTEFSERMYRDQFQVSLTTLPSFHFGTGQMLMSPCLLLAQDAPIIQSGKTQSTLLNSFMSGWYQIVDFKHNISSRNATSEFTLIKMPASLKSPKLKEFEVIDEDVFLGG